MSGTGNPSRQELNAMLVDHGYWLPSAVPGVVGRTERFERIVRGFEEILLAIGREVQAERVEFPPVIDRELIRRTDYMESFPELCGSIHSYREPRGKHLDLIDAVDRGEPWAGFLEQMPLTLCPAACYSLYPTCKGRLPEGGREFDLSAYVFRAEPSDDPARLQSFRMREKVRLGEPEMVQAWRASWVDRGLELLATLGLEATRVVASDPFFGRAGRMLAANQVAEELKFEIEVPITSREAQTAVCSFNYHEAKFGSIFEIEDASGESAHSACLGFGLERVVLALIAKHGPDEDCWPADVRTRLNL